MIAIQAANARAARQTSALRTDIGGSLFGSVVDRLYHSRDGEHTALPLGKGPQHSIDHWGYCSAMVEKSGKFPMSMDG